MQSLSVVTIEAVWWSSQPGYVHYVRADYHDGARRMCNDRHRGHVLIRHHVYTLRGMIVL